jgi:hypothetical protein
MIIGVFAWAVLSALYPSDKHSERLSKYRPHLQSINLTGLKFLLPLIQATKFEKMNPNISVNVYAYDEDEQDFIPKHVTKCGERENHVHLLLLSSKTNDNFHYVWIKRMSALVSIAAQIMRKKSLYVHIAFIRFDMKNHSKIICPIVRDMFTRWPSTPARNRTSI